MRWTSPPWLGILVVVLELVEFPLQLADLAFRNDLLWLCGSLWRLCWWSCLYGRGGVRTLRRLAGVAVVLAADALGGVY